MPSHLGWVWVVAVVFRATGWAVSAQLPVHAVPLHLGGWVFSLLSLPEYLGRKFILSCPVLIAASSIKTALRGMTDA